MKEPINKADFIDWTHNPVTLAFFDSIRERVHELERGLAQTAGENSIQDNRIVGMVQFAKTVMDVAFDEISSNAE